MADFRIDAISADDKIGFGGLAVGEGELNTYVGISQIGRLLAEMDLLSLDLDLELSRHGELVVPHNCNAFRFCERGSLILVPMNLTVPASRRYSPVCEERDIH